MSQVLLVVASVLVLGFVAWAFWDKYRSQQTRAQRLLFITVIAAGSAVGLEGERTSALVRGITWGLVAVLAVLTGYAKLREPGRPIP